jgi:putative ABC transport system permease protein
MTLELGPVVRALRRHPGIWLLVVMELAAGVTSISALLLGGGWYGKIGAGMSGLDEENLVALSTYSPHAAGDDAAGAERQVRQTLLADRARFRALAHVVDVTAVSSNILDDRWNFPWAFSAEGGRPSAPETLGWGVYTGDGWAATLALPFLAGAAPTAYAGARDRPAAAVLTRSLAVALFGSVTDAVGRRISAPTLPATLVVGVVRDVRMRIPFMPRSDAVAFLFGGAPVTEEVRLMGRAEPGYRDAVVAAARAEFAPDNAARFVDVRRFDSRRGKHHRVGNGLDGFLSAFGGMLGIVVLVGALATTSFLVAQRTRTIGVRRAVGATRADIVGYFLLESVLATSAGTLLGLGGAAVLYPVMQRVFQGIVFQLQTVVMALVVLWGASILATLIPALRAARIPPSVASRTL